MKSKAQEAFEERRKDYTDREILIETLYATWQIQRATENTRANTNKIVWIIVVGIIISFVAGFFGAALLG